MKSNRILAICILLIGVGFLNAQTTIYDANRWMGSDLNGTARFVGMGGAMGALGGDISTIGTNPAGIGVYRSNDFMVSLGFSSFGSESKFLDCSTQSNHVQGSFDNIGFVIASKISNQSALHYVNFGFNYHKAKSFYKNTEMNGNLGNHSQTFVMAEQAGGVFNWPQNPFDDPNGEIGWLSAVGYEGYLLMPIEGTDDQYVGMYNNSDAHFHSQERGGIDQYDFNVSFNINDRIYLGLTIGAYAVDYRKHTSYSEAYTGVNTPEKYNLQGWNKVKGSGFDIKFGTIIRPFEYSPFRIGLSVHTPTFYNLNYKTSVYLESDVLNAETGEIDLWSVNSRDYLSEGGNMVQEFRLQTPWVFNGSFGYTAGKNLALGAEYEYKDYSSMTFKDANSHSGSYSAINGTTSNLKGVHTIRLGAEYKVISQLALRIGYNYSTAAFHSKAFKDLPFNSIQTDTDFANTKAINNYTLGIGYYTSVFYTDLAYKFSTYKEDFFPFACPELIDDKWSPGLPNITKITNISNHILLTIGLRF